MAYYKIDNRYYPIDTTNHDPVQRTLQNCKNLLMTHMGEVPYDRMRGFDARLLTLPMSLLRQELIKELDRVMLWEPDAQVADAECSLQEDGTVTIVVTLSIDLEED